MKYSRWMLVSILVAFLVVGGPSAGGPKVKYTDKNQVETVTLGFGSTDLQAIAEQMVQSMLQSPAIKDRPVVVVSKVENKTSEDIDTKAITDKIRVALTQSGKVRFLAAERRDEQMAERDYQKMSGNVDQRTAPQEGRELAAQFQIGGEIVSIVKRTESEKAVYYKFTLNLVDLQTGVIEWADEKEITKIASRRAVGR